MADQEPFVGTRALAEYKREFPDAELTPAGLNLVDGRNAAFGYVVEGTELLKKLEVGDQILSIKVVDGADRLKPHA